MVHVNIPRLAPDLQQVITYLVIAFALFVVAWRIYRLVQGKGNTGCPGCGKRNCHDCS